MTKGMKSERLASSQLFNLAVKKKGKKCFMDVWSVFDHK